MEGKDFLSKITPKTNSQPPSLFEQIQGMLSIPKKPSMSDILKDVITTQPMKDVFQSKEVDKLKDPPRNPKYVMDKKILLNLWGLLMFMKPK